MNSVFKPLLRVRVQKLLHDAQSYDGWRVNKRAPQVGDCGTVLDVLSGPNLPNKYVVESCLHDGSSLWLADFYAEELEIDQTAEV